MSAFPCAHASGDDADRLVDDCLAQIGAAPAGANLGFVYATDALAADLPAIVERLRARSGVQRWTGTVGVGICASGREYYDRPALALMLASFPEGAFYPLPLQSGAVDPFFEAAGDWLQRDSFHLGILHGDPSHPQTPQIIDELAARTPGAFFVGGLTSSNGSNPQVGATVSGGGVGGLLLSSEVPVASGHSQGCTPIAERHAITASEQNILIELDGRPALDVFLEDVGDIIAKDLSRVAGYIFAALPIAGSDTGDYMVRNLVGIDPERKLLAIGDIAREGGEIMFCRRDGNSAREDLERMLDDIGGRIGPAPRGALYYSCLGRGRYQFGDDSEELKMIRDRIGDIPLVGFFANGEIFHNRLYGYTGVLTVFC